jgi:hypothetical protein
MERSTLRCRSIGASFTRCSRRRVSSADCCLAEVAASRMTAACSDGAATVAERGPYQVALLDRAGRSNCWADPPVSRPATRSLAVARCSRLSDDAHGCSVCSISTAPAPGQTSPALRQSGGEPRALLVVRSDRLVERRVGCRSRSEVRALVRRGRAVVLAFQASGLDDSPLARDAAARNVPAKPITRSATPAVHRRAVAVHCPGLWRGAYARPLG